MRTHGAIVTTAAALALCLGLPTVGAAGSKKPSAAHHPATAAPEHFIKEAATGGMAEVKLGRLAEDRAANNEVKSFGQRMADDHSKVNAELESLAASKKVTLPKTLDSKDKALYDRLSKMSGKQFDRAYMDAMLQDHRHDVAAFETAAKSKDPDVQAFASKTLPTLQDHLQDAERIAAGEGMRGGGGSHGR